MGIMILICLNWLKIAVAMGNASQEVKDAADETTNDIDDDGIYHCLKKHHLI